MNLKVYCNDEERIGPRSAVGFVQVYVYDMVSAIKLKEIVMYPVHVVPLNFTVQFVQSIIYRGHTFGVFWTVVYEQD